VPSDRRWRSVVKDSAPRRLAQLLLLVPVASVLGRILAHELKELLEQALERGVPATARLHAKP